MQEVLQLQPFIEEWKAEGFLVYFASTLTETDIERFKDTHQVVHMPVLLDPQRRLFNQYGVRGVPITFILDTEGRIQIVKPGWGPGSLEELKDWVQRLAPGG